MVEGSRLTIDRLTTPILTIKQNQLLRLICALGNPKAAARQLGVSRQFAYREANKFVALGLIDKKKIDQKHHVFYLTGKEWSCYGMPNQVDNPMKWRVHAIEIYYKVRPALIPDWEQMKIKYAELPNHRLIESLKQMHFQLENISMKTTSNGVIVYAPDIYATSVGDARRKLVKAIKVLGEQINAHFKLAIFKPQWGNVEFTKSPEVAFMHDVAAKKYIDSNLRAMIKVDGERRFTIDFSKDVPEAEFISTRISQEDALKYEKFIKLLITDEFVPSNIKQRIENIEKAIYKIASLPPIKDQKALTDFKPDYIG